jgi:pteridine reductase
VRVNGVAPGADRVARRWAVSSGRAGGHRRHTLLGRTGAPSDIARTVAFLLFDAPYITGQIIAVDGGRSAHL